MNKQQKKYLFANFWMVFGVVFVLTVGISFRWSGRDSERKVTHSSENRSNIQFSERSIRLKPVNSGETSLGSILIKNIGKNTIREAEIMANCSCSEVKIPKTTINPGETIRANFSIDTKGRDHDFVTNFILKYTEEGQKLFDVFQVAASVVSPGKMTAVPPLLLFNDVYRGKSFDKTIELRIKDMPQNNTVDILDISSPDWVSTHIIKKDDYWILALTGNFPDQSGRHVDFVQIKSSSHLYSELTIPIILEYGTNSHSQ